MAHAHLRQWWYMVAGLLTAVSAQTPGSYTTVKPTAIIDPPPPVNRQREKYIGRGGITVRMQDGAEQNEVGDAKGISIW